MAHSTSRGPTPADLGRSRGAPPVAAAGADPPPDAAQRVTRHEIAAWVITAVALILVLRLELLTALIGGLLVYELMHVLEPRLQFGRLSSTAARLVAAGALSAVIIALVVAAVLGAIAFVRSDTGGLSALMNRLAEIVETSRAYLPAWMVSSLPSDADGMKNDAVNWLREHARAVGTLGRELGSILLQLVVGMIIGAMIALHDVLPDRPLPAFAAALLERVRRVADAFRRVVFAQVRIAAINAVLTAFYLVVALPLFGIHLPFAKTLVLVTFVCGLIPVVGNLISNTLIVLVALSRSLVLAVISLAFLVVIHKLEYFLNARIVGAQIRARAWELLIAMLVMEAAFGGAGLVAAPIYYAYLKDELTDRNLI
jgi:predicted PurR-regulated permease PerM